MDPRTEPPASRRPAAKRLIPLAVLLLLAGGMVWALLADPTVPGAPAVDATTAPETAPTPQEVGGYDLFGTYASPAEAEALAASEPERLTPERGAVAITEELLALGRDTFYTETFGNEHYFTDVLGVLDGPLDLFTLSRALIAQGGRPTTDLQVRLPRDVRVGGRLLPEGTVLDTGLDVPPGWLVPLGMRVGLVDGRIEVGVTCALCHAAVDPDSGRIVQGAPNADLDTGLILALGSNSASFFRNTGVDPLALAEEAPASDGSGLPDPDRLEEEVDRHLLAWPPGSFDSTVDLVNNPSQIPTSFTFGAWPYGWNGFSATGWFRGLTTLNNNVHALNSDPTTGFGQSEALMGIEAEAYLALLLRRAAAPRYRPREGELPSEALARVDPTPVGPALNSVVPMPDFPAGSAFIPDGLLVNSAGMPFARELNAVSAWQNTLAPPPTPGLELQTLELGARVFDEAGCAECHAGRTFTDHRVIPQPRIGTQGSRARALAAFTRVLEPSRTYPPGLEVPLPDDPPVLEVPVSEAQERILSLAYATEVPEGGYKVPSLIGLTTSAPYLHDGGVAAARGAFDAVDAGGEPGPDGLGLPGTLLRGVPVDPAAGLRALLDRELRAAVVEANRASPDLRLAHVTGEGHAFWVDEGAGFAPEEQAALVAFLLSLDDDPEVLPPSATPPATPAPEAAREAATPPAR